MERLSTNEIAELTGVHSNTIRRYADRGYIESKRDFRGWRFYPEPMKTVKKIKALLEGDLNLDGQQKQS
jgi:excisionase family DNA binding protein